MQRGKVRKSLMLKHGGADLNVSLHVNFARIKSGTMLFWSSEVFKLVTVHRAFGKPSTTGEDRANDAY